MQTSTTHCTNSDSFLESSGMIIASFFPQRAAGNEEHYRTNEKLEAIDPWLASGGAKSKPPPQRCYDELPLVIAEDYGDSDRKFNHCLWVASTTVLARKPG